MSIAGVSWGWGYHVVYYCSTRRHAKFLLHQNRQLFDSTTWGHHFPAIHRPRPRKWRAYASGMRYSLCWRSVLKFTYANQSPVATSVELQNSYPQLSRAKRLLYRTVSEHRCCRIDASHIALPRMSKYGVLITGPAGAGKSTFASALIQHLRSNKRACYYVNLDPAAEEFVYEPDIDIKDLITLEDVMEEMHLGPNGGLIYCFEFLLENLDFLTDPLEEVTDEYLIIFDMPGQIELYTHVPILPNLVKTLTRGSLNINLCAAYLLESTFIVDRAKFFAGTLSAMSAMLMLEVPHVNILSKMDQVKGTIAKKDLKRFIDPDVSLLDETPANGLTYAEEEEHEDPKDSQSVMGGHSFNKLNRAVAQLIDNFSMVSFLKLDVQDEDSVGAVLSYIDDAIQYHEAQEPKEPQDEIQDQEMD